MCALRNALQYSDICLQRLNEIASGMYTYIN